MSQYTIHTDTLFDPKLKSFLSDVSITVETISGSIVKVYRRTEALQNPVEAPDVDLRGKYVMPGDLGSESMQDADCNVRDAINRGLTPGPRLFVATDIITSTGTYEARTENRVGGTRLPALSDAADGTDEIIRAVRRRIAQGADVIKFYADYRRRAMRFPPTKGGGGGGPATNEDIVAYSLEEMSALVAEAQRAGCPVAAHAASNAAVMLAARAGALSIEHAYGADDETLRCVHDHGCILVPTLAVCEHLHRARMPAILAATQRAWTMGIQLACGGDTGAFPHGDNAREMELMVDAGIPVPDVLAACTLGGWKACGGDACGRRFGWLQAGTAADIIALDADPRMDPQAMRKVSFVMKDAKVWKKDGVAVGMI
ncbi:MAG: hypothetical protein M1818_007082 [Claussenomyces sp. TS43310]|nr:MAG: hypothetical protein M1818_007082 [Claussenomyces sp. TS43310]